MAEPGERRAAGGRADDKRQREDAERSDPEAPSR